MGAPPPPRKGGETGAKAEVKTSGMKFEDRDSESSCGLKERGPRVKEAPPGSEKRSLDPKRKLR